MSFTKISYALLSALMLAVAVAPSVATYAAANDSEPQAVTIASNQTDTIVADNEKSVAEEMPSSDLPSVDYVTVDGLKVATLPDGNVWLDYESGLAIDTWSDEDGLHVVAYAPVADDVITPRVLVSKWGKYHYDHLAVGDTLFNSVINFAKSVSIGAVETAVAAALHIPKSAIIGLFGGLGNEYFSAKTSKNYAKKFDKNGNGWVEVYVRNGYNAAGKVVATQFTLK